MNTTTQTTPNDTMIKGINTTLLNREFIIRITPKDAHGKLAETTKLVTAAQLVNMLCRDAAREKVLREKLAWVARNRKDITTVKLRTFGKIEFNNR